MLYVSFNSYGSLSIDNNVFSKNTGQYIVYWNSLSLTLSNIPLANGRVRFRNNVVSNNFPSTATSPVPCVMHYASTGGEPVAIVRNNIFNNPAFSCEFRTQMNYPIKTSKSIPFTFIPSTWGPT